MYDSPSLVNSSSIQGPLLGSITILPSTLLTSSQVIGLVREAFASPWAHRGFGRFDDGFRAPHERVRIPEHPTIRCRVPVPRLRFCLLADEGREQNIGPQLPIRRLENHDD